MKEVQSLCAQVRQTAYDIHLYHGHGHFEKVYENALAHRLREAGLDVKQQHPIRVFDEDGTIIGDYYADLLVDGWLIVELKNCQSSGRRACGSSSWLLEVRPPRARFAHQLRLL